MHKYIHLHIYKYTYIHTYTYMYTSLFNSYYFMSAKKCWRKSCIINFTWAKMEFAPAIFEKLYFSKYSIKRCCKQITSIQKRVWPYKYVLPRLVNNQKEARQWNFRISRQELADGKNFIEIYNGNETKLTKIPFFIFFPSSKCVKIARSAIQRNPIDSSYQRIKKKITFSLCVSLSALCLSLCLPVWLPACLPACLSLKVTFNGHWNDDQINLLVLNLENIFCSVKLNLKFSRPNSQK